MAAPARIRLACGADGEALASIYRPAVEGITSFEATPPDGEDMAQRVEQTLARTPWLVCELDGRVAGYAYASRHREREAYRWTAEVSAYVDDRCHRRGVGRALYTSLFALLEAQRLATLVAGIALPNAASVAFHESMGFTAVGVFRRVGFKLDARSTSPGSSATSHGPPHPRSPSRWPPSSHARWQPAWRPASPGFAVDVAPPHAAAVRSQHGESAQARERLARRQRRGPRWHPAPLPRAFELWISADEEADAHTTRGLLGGGMTPHPWLRVLLPQNVVPPLTALPLAGILVTRTGELSPALAGVRNALRAQAVPVVVVMAGETGPAASAPRVGEDARVAVTDLGESATLPMAATLLGRFDDDRRLSLARQLPPLRTPFFQSLTQEVAQANASFALTTGLAETVPVLSAPLNLGDIVVLTKNQLLLGYRIALAGGRDGEPRKLIAEIVGVLGGGLLFRQIAREMVGLIPIAGIPLKVAVAYSGTWAIGRAVALWVSGRPRDHRGHAARDDQGRASMRARDPRRPDDRRGAGSRTVTRGGSGCAPTCRARRRPR